MPPRWLSLAIVTFWLATTGWLFWHELWPTWRPGEPPPFHIDLVEEVQKRDELKTYWTVNRNDQNVFRASTWVDYQRDEDAFTLHAEFRSRKDQEAPKVFVGLLKVEKMSSEYRVNRAGQLLSLRAEIGGTVKQLSLEVGVALWGEVRDEQFFAHYRFNASLIDRPIKGDFPPAPVSYHGSVLMPLHPVNRIHGLRPGQSWRMPLVDPFRDASATLLGISGGVPHLNARVLPEPRELALGGFTTTCLVIEYEGEDMSARTWVEQHSELVQRQEFNVGKDNWVIQRDLQQRRP